MSILFFHKGLSQAKELVSEGLPGASSEARKIIASHQNDIGQDELREVVAFRDLTNHSRIYRSLLTDADNAIRAEKKELASEKLNAAIKMGHVLVEDCKKIASLCKDEELKAA